MSDHDLSAETPFQRVLVGVDGGEGGRDAIALARLLAAPGADLTLAHVHCRVYTTARMQLPAVDRLDHEAGERLLLEARARAEIDARLVVKDSTSPARGLHELAEAHDFDLIVLGSCHRGALGRAMLGDDTRAALNGSPCAIAVAPRGYAADPSPLRVVGVGYADSAEADQVLAAARELAARFGARVHVLRVVMPPPYMYTGLLPPAGEGPQELAGRERAKLAGLEDVDVSVCSGVPREELARFSSSVGLLVIGSRASGAVRRLIEGSTSRRLLSHSHAPLLVLPGAVSRSQAEQETEGKDVRLDAAGAPAVSRGARSVLFRR